MNIQREKTHGKLLNITSGHNKVPKKNNPNEMTSRKRNIGNYEPTNFVHFKNDAMKHRCNNFVLANDLPDVVVDIKRLTPLDKTCHVGLKM